MGFCFITRGCFGWIFQRKNGGSCMQRASFFRKKAKEDIGSIGVEGIEEDA